MTRTTLGDRIPAARRHIALPLGVVTATILIGALVGARGSEGPTSPPTPTPAATEGFYFDADTGGLRTTVSYSGLAPLIAGIVPPDRLPRVLGAIRDPDRLLSDHGLRSMSAAEYIYTPGYAGRGVNSNWRGPIWLPYSYLLIESLDTVDPALASDLRERTIATVETNWKTSGRIWEYFDGDNGIGLGADAQTGWTATVANLIHEAYPAR